MRAQDFAAAWRVADSVLAQRDPATRDDPDLPYHQRWVWDGTPPDGRHVLVRCYHGLGDTLQFARFLPALGARAASVTLEAQAELLPILSAIRGVDRLVPFDQARPLPPEDCTAEIMDLAHLLRATPQEASACVPYLACPPCSDPAGVAGGALALCWEAGEWDRLRSVPLPALLAACAGSGRRLISLQRGTAASQATDPDFINPGEADSDVVRTAALICAASLIITVDTMVAHLAGALGRPAVLLLRHGADWRWPSGGQPSVWYPTLTILAQPSPGDWREPLDRLALLLGSGAADSTHPA